MREILFKAKRIDDGEWVYGDILHDYDNEPRAIRDYCGSNPIVPETVCQYTGLKDKNGVKIWENDIVKIDKQFLTGTFKVVFNKSAKGKYSLNAITFEEVNHYVNAKECVEVIGNVFDNSELMEGE